MGLRRLLGRLAGRWSGRRGATDPLSALAGARPDDLRLVVGLGNPGPRFARTRHNIGFWTLDRLAARLELEWLDDTRRTASLLAVACLEAGPAAVRGAAGAGASRATALVLAKPQTFMNASGEAAAALVERLELDLSHLLVVYDDMDLPLGTLRLRERGSAGTHNGMRHVVATLGSQAIPRLRVGVGQAVARDARAYVLDAFAPDEQPVAAAAMQRAAEAALCWAYEGAATAMNRFNR